MKNMTLTFISITMGLLLGRYYSFVQIKVLMEYILAANLSVRLMNNDDEGDLITVRK
jgi:hypothetical protein